MASRTRLTADRRSETDLCERESVGFRQELTFSEGNPSTAVSLSRPPTRSDQ